MVSIQELKKNLSRLLDEAAEGERIIIARHQQPVAALVSAEAQHVHVGHRSGKGQLQPAFGHSIGGDVLKILNEDRGNNR